MSPPFVAASFAPLLKYLLAYAFLPLKLLFMTFIFIDCTTECRRQSRVKWKMSKRQRESVRVREREHCNEATMKCLFKLSSKLFVLFLGRLLAVLAS